MPELNKTILRNSANLKAYYKLEANSNDETANAYNGTDTTVTYGAAKFGNGASLGASSRIVLPSAVAGGSPVSVVFWFRPANNASDAYVITDYDAGSSTGMGILLSSSEQIGIGVNGGTNTIQSAALSTTEFSHIAIIINGASSAIYVNGKATAGTLAAMTNNTNNVRINGRWVTANTGDAVQGVFEIDDLAFYDSALSADQIKELYEGRYLGELRPNQYGTTRALYHLSDTTDSSGNGYNLTNNGTVTFPAGKFGNAADFGTSNTSKSLSIANDIGITGGAVTMLCWAKLNTEIASGDYDIIETGDVGTRVTNLVRYSYNSGTRQINFWRVKQGSAVDGPAYTITLGTSIYHMIAYTYDGTNVRGYVDGNLVGGPTAASGNGTSGGADLTRIGGATGSFANALVDEAMFSSTALTANQIRQIYALGVGKYY